MIIFVELLLLLLLFFIVFRNLLLLCLLIISGIFFKEMKVFMELLVSMCKIIDVFYLNLIILLTIYLFLNLNLFFLLLDWQKICTL